MIRGEKLIREVGPRLILLTNGTYSNLLELWLDDDEAGDFTDPLNGYDIKYKRTGTGLLDTEYKVLKCKESKLPKPYRNEIYDPEKMLREVMPSYEETLEMVEKVLGGYAR